MDSEHRPDERACDSAPAEDAPEERERAAVPDPLPLVLTVEEVAAILRVNRKTAYEAVAAGTIPGARWLGKTIRVSRDAVLEWLRSGQGRVRSRRSK